MSGKERAIDTFERRSRQRAHYLNASGWGFVVLAFGVLIGGVVAIISAPKLVRMDIEEAQSELRAQIADAREDLNRVETEIARARIVAFTDVQISDDERDSIIVGSDGTIFYSDDQGRNWSMLPYDVLARNYNFNAVALAAATHATDGNVAVAVADGGLVAWSSDPSGRADRWKQLEAPASEDLNDIAIVPGCRWGHRGRRWGGYPCH